MLRPVGGWNVQVDILINNAGILRSIDITARPYCTELVREVEREISISLTAQVLLTAALLDHVRRPGGVVVNVTSVLARHPKASAPVYCASKAGLKSFTFALRHQLRPFGIKVVDAVPPLVDTAMIAGRGSGKISADQAATAVISGIASGMKEIRIGKTKAFFLLDRFMPGLAARLMIGT